MKYVIFRNLEETATDFRTALLAFQTARADAGDITTAIETKIICERARDTDRAAELTAIIKDPARSATIRRMAQGELDALAEKTYAPTPSETAAFDAAIAEGEQALKDADALRCKMIDQLREAKTMLEEPGKETVFRPDGGIDIRRRWLDGEKEHFAAMLARVGREAQK